MKEQLLEGKTLPDIAEVLKAVKKRNYDFETLVWKHKEGDNFYTLIKRN